MPPIIDTEKCIGCGACLNICPYNLVLMENYKAIFNDDDAECTNCGNCVEKCPQEVITIR